jgi:hypothetical protein
MCHPMRTASIEGVSECNADENIWVVRQKLRRGRSFIICTPHQLLLEWLDEEM